ncbi:MAG: aldehyde dehydrogenase family protein [Saprospiraceae bacterium]|nr:aldehyde dehydrogenase family protein [Saprospiraceae bacterium]
MKRLGITQTLTNYEFYPKWFTKDDLGEDIQLVHLSFEHFDLPLLATLDGVLLTGGIDIYPGCYTHFAPYPNAPSDFQHQRDLFESLVYHYAKTMKMPILGICRGHQLINILEGGKLIQDLGLPGNHKHRADGKDKEHDIMVLEGSYFHSITKQLNGKVNSSHHQAIDPEHIGHNLIPVAWSEEDGVIEAIEYKDTSDTGYLLAVQYHPERMSENCTHSFSENIRKDFLTAIRQTNFMTLDIKNPATGQILTSLHVDQPASIKKKYDLLLDGQKEWAKVPLGERISKIKAFADLLEAEKEKLAEILTSEVGKPLQQSRNEINGAISRINWLSGNALKYLSDEVMFQDENITEVIRYEPLGVIANISAWNYPYLVGVNVFIPALLSGNAVAYKPSEYASLTAETGEELLRLPLDGYFFTGSYKTGQYIYTKVAPKMVICQCELGGKDPLYVTDDVENVGAVAAGTADGAFYNNGQSCCAVERIYVHEKVYDAYLDAFVKEVSSWKMGDPKEDGVYLGALTRESQLDFLENQVQDALQKGAVLLAGGKRLDRPGYYFEPTVLGNVTHEMMVMKEESFGPIIGIMSVKNDEEALKLMSDTEYGLTAAVYSVQRDRAENLLSKLNTGTGYWNCCDRVSAALPWSGRQQSGFGATLSHAGIRTFTKVKGYHLRG